MRTKLAWIRTARGMSQRQLSEASGVPMRAIEDYEQRCRSIDLASAHALWKLATALGTTMESLMEHDIEK